MGIVSDPELLQAIKMEMPAWFYDPHVDRVRWINQTLDTMWPSLDQVGRFVFFRRRHFGDGGSASASLVMAGHTA